MMIRKNFIFWACIIFSLLLHSQNGNLRFEKNEGQWNKEVYYKADFKQGKIFVLQNKINIVVFDSNNRYYHPHGDNPDNNIKERYSVFSIQPYLADFNNIVSENKLSGYTNYFCGNDKSKWKSRIPSYQSVIYKDVYPYVDWEVSSEDNMPKHSFIVHSGGDVNSVKTLYKGVKNVYAKEDKLYIITNDGNVQEDGLYVFQNKGNDVIKIKSGYSVGRSEEGFIVSYVIDEYDKERDLIIDPALVFCTYSGAHSDNWGMTSCYDKHGLMISGGVVYGNDYPTTEGAYNTEYSNNWDCVITKYDSLGRNMIFSTFLGGEYCEIPHSMIVNNNDEVVIFGTTGSGDFPTTDNAFQSYFRGGQPITYESSLTFPFGIDIFITAFNANGTDLVASTFIGGSDNDGFNYKDYYGSNMQTLYEGNDSLYANYGDCARGEIAVDGNNNVFIASSTFSNNFPTTLNAYKVSSSGGQDAVVFKLDRSLSSLIYSTYLGGTMDDAAYSIDIDSVGRAYVCGGTVSGNFPVTPQAYNITFNGGTTDAFLTVLSKDGGSLVYSTFFGSSEYDQAFFVRLDRNTYPYIFGQTKAPGSTLIHNAAYAIPNSGQFVAKFSPQLDSLCFSTVFGSGDGMVNISPSGFTVDVCDRIYCAGWGRRFKYNKNNFGYTSLGTENLETTSDAYMDFTDGMDFYIMSMAADASQLDYATFFGEYDDNIYFANDHVDGGTSRFDRYGNLYLTICASCRGSQGMPTTSQAYSSSNNSENCNIASVKFSVHDDFAVADFFSENIYCKNKEMQFTNYSRADSYQWDFGDSSPVSYEKDPVHTYLNGGEYTVTLIASLSYGCRQTDTVSKKILILNNTSEYLDTLSICENKPINIGIEGLALNSEEEISFSWTPQQGLSDPNIINPYAIIDSSTLYRLIVSANGCQDTFFRFVQVDTMQSEIPDTLFYCSVPYVYTVENTLQRKISCAWDRDFLNPAVMVNNNTAVRIDDYEDKYLYVRYSIDGCSGTDSIMLHFTGVKCEIVVQDAGCMGDSSGSAEVKLLDNTSNVHYEWSCSPEDTCFIDNLAAGTYTVKVFSEDNECFTQLTFTVLALTEMNIEYDVVNSSCNTLCNGKVSVNVSGGETPYTFLWNDGTQGSVKDNVCAGEYTVTVTDNSGCSAKQTVTVSNEYDVEVKLSATENNCATGCSAIITSEVFNGKEPYKYTWNGGQTSADLTDVCNGNYILTVEDADGCKDTAQVSVTSNNISEHFEAYADKDKVYDGAKIHLSSTYIEGFTYYWTPATYLNTPDNYETDGTIYETTTYNVYITDSKGCNNNANVKIDVEYVNCDKPNIFIPNAFTPNNDGKNDVLYVSGEYISSIDLRIYDRWGELVFRSEDINDGWDGKFRNKDCQAGVYYYKLEVKCEGGKTFLTGGDITLIR